MGPLLSVTKANVATQTNYWEYFSGNNAKDSDIVAGANSSAENVSGKASSEVDFFLDAEIHNEVLFDEG